MKVPEDHKVTRFSVHKELLMRFKARILYDELPQTAFFEEIVKLYVEQDDAILYLIDELKQRYKIQKAAARKKNIRLRDRGRKVNDMFEISPQELSEIYDVLEEDLDVIL